MGEGEGGGKLIQGTRSIFSGLSESPLARLRAIYLYFIHHWPGLVGYRTLGTLHTILAPKNLIIVATDSLGFWNVFNPHFFPFHCIVFNNELKTLKNKKIYFYGFSLTLVCIPVLSFETVFPIAFLLLRCIKTYFYEIPLSLVCIPVKRWILKMKTSL